MVLFDWNETYQTKIPTIDQQHKKLIDLINELNEAMRVGKGKEVTDKILKELTEYTVYHFGFEEKAFEKYDYLKKEEHKKEHQDLIKQLNDIIDKYKRNEIGINITVLDFLSNWIKVHIVKEDMLYVPYLTGKEL
jgi:hemerythrin-like metal-binding protein